LISPSFISDDNLGREARGYLDGTDRTGIPANQARLHAGVGRLTELLCDVTLSQAESITMHFHMGFRRAHQYTN
jgi:hypothetical protein